MNLQPHQKHYTCEYMYNNTLNRLKNEKNYELMKKYANPFIKNWGQNYTEYIDNKIYETVYNKMKDNIINSKLKTILDSVFGNKKKIKEGTILYTAFSTYTNNKDINDFKSIITYDNNTGYNGYEKDDIIKNLYQIHSDAINKRNNLFSDLFKYFTVNRNKGTLYTTSFMDYNDPAENTITGSLTSRFFTKNYNESKFLLISKCKKDTYLYDLGTQNFKMRILFKRIITNILFGGTFYYDITPDELMKQHNTLKMFKQYPKTCAQLYNTANDKECVSGYWDGDNSLYDTMVNHFIDVYNTKNSGDKILGYLGRDKPYDEVVNEFYPMREIVWINNEELVDPIGIYSKNIYITSPEVLYAHLSEYLYENQNDVIKETPINYTEEDIKKIIKNLYEAKPLEFKLDLIQYNNENDFKEALTKIDLKNIVLGNPEKNDLYHLRGGNYKYKYLKYKKKYLELLNQ